MTPANESVLLKLTLKAMAEQQSRPASENTEESPHKMFCLIENKLVLLPVSPHLILHTATHSWSLIFGNARTQSALISKKFVFSSCRALDYFKLGYLELIEVPFASISPSGQIWGHHDVGCPTELVICWPSADDV